MKKFYVFVCVLGILVACDQKEAKQDSEKKAEKEYASSDEVFAKNSETVLKILEGFENESIDYSMYSEDFIQRGTGFGDNDTITLAETIEMEKGLWLGFDFELMNKPVNLLPGVNVDSKKADGSVRVYSNWKITRPATDSTEARSAIIKLYESWDFDENGKVLFQQVYGDFSGTFGYLMGAE